MATVGLVRASRCPRGSRISSLQAMSGFFNEVWTSVDSMQSRRNRYYFYSFLRRYYMVYSPFY